MDLIKKQVDELMENQNHMLVAIKFLDERMNDLSNKVKDKEPDDFKDIRNSQAMIDEIIVKNSDDISVMRKTKELNAIAIKTLETKIVSLAEEIEMSKKKIMESDTREGKVRSEIKCNFCNETFDKTNDLEKHIKTLHANHEKFLCEQCDKDFVLKWRLEKHVQIHTQKFVQYCHYYNNDKFCPFEELGCKFLHTIAQKCRLGHKCKIRLCPRRHSESDTETDRDTKHVGDNDETEDKMDECISFVTSTPQKNEFECGECENMTQNCTDCFVRQHEETGQLANRKRKVHFKEFVDLDI